MSEQAQDKPAGQGQPKAAAGVPGATSAAKVPWWRSLDRNVVFMHIPKAGGSTVRSFIADHVDADQVFPQDQLHHFPSYESLKTRRTMLFMSHLGYHFVRDGNADPITLLRHPVERLLSLYSYTRNPGKFIPVIDPSFAKGKTLTQFFQSEEPQIAMNVRDAMTWQLASGYHAPHRNLVRARGIEDSDVQQRAIRTLRRCVVVGVLEDLPRFYDAVDEFFGKKAPRPSKVVNASRDRIRWADLTAEEKAAVEDNVQMDWVTYDKAKALAG